MLNYQRVQQWPFGERHCNQNNGPDNSTACQLRWGFARTTGCDVCVMVSKAQGSIHAPALLWIPIPRVYACVCVCLCVCVCDSKPAVKVYCTWWWNDDNSLVFSEETVKFSADFNSFRRKLEEFDDSKRIVCNQMVAGLLYVDIYTLSTCKTCTWKWNEILRNITALCMFNIFMIPFHASTIMYACLTEKHRTLFRTAFFHSRVTLWCSQLPQRRLLLFAGLKKFGYRQVARAKESFTFGSWDILSALIGSDASWCITVPTVIFFHPKLHYV